ncbi:MAG TPA: 30S ribosomal protein S17 [Spirochaetales bacterium]|nr:30S ribosomal protein S17 [Spirochaetales bacterium]
MEKKQPSNKRILQGEVVSDKMQKTIVVLVSSRKMHRLYKKYITVSKKYKAHDENQEAHMGDTVRIIESRPISKEKRWKLLQVVEKAR